MGLSADRGKLLGPVPKPNAQGRGRSWVHVLSRNFRDVQSRAVRALAMFTNLREVWLVLESN